MTTWKWWKAAAIRALRTFAQAALATIGTAALLSQVNWIAVLSASGLAAVMSILTSIALGMPEAPTEGGETDDRE